MFSCLCLENARDDLSLKQKAMIYYLWRATNMDETTLSQPKRKTIADY